VSPQCLTIMTSTPETPFLDAAISPAEPSEPRLQDDLTKLLNSSDGENSVWLLDQLRGLAQSDVVAAQTPIHSVAVSLSFSTLEEKQTLSRSLLKGIASLPPERRVEAIQRFTQLAIGLTPGGVAREDHGTPDRPQAARASDMDTARSVATMVENAKQLIEILDGGSTKDQKKDLFQTANEEASCTIWPILEVFDAITESDRHSFMDGCVHVGIVPPDRCEYIKEMVQIGGQADKLAKFLRGAQSLQFYIGLAFGFPLMELVILMRLLPQSCGTLLDPWLFIDCVLGMAVVSAAHVSWTALQPAVQQLAEQPIHTVIRVRNAILSGADIREEVTDLDRATRVVEIWLFFVWVGAVWALVGIGMVMITNGDVGEDCALANTLVCSAFIGLRLGGSGAVVLLQRRIFATLNGIRSQGVRNHGGLSGTEH